jgi:hypothetical protein
VYYVFNILNKIAVGSHELHVLGMARQNWVTHIVLSGQQHLSLGRCFNVLMYSNETTERLQTGSLKLSPQYSTEVCATVCSKICLLGSMKPNCQKQTRKVLCSDIFPSTWLMVKAFLSLGMKKESVAVNCRQKYSKWNGISHLIPGISLRQPLQQWKSWPFFFWGQNVWCS